MQTTQHQAMTGLTTKVMSAFWTHRRAILFSIFLVWKPGAPFLTINAFTCSAVQCSAMHKTSIVHHTQTHTDGYIRNKCNYL